MSPTEAVELASETRRLATLSQDELQGISAEMIWTKSVLSRAKLQAERLSSYLLAFPPGSSPP